MKNLLLIVSFVWACTAIAQENSTPAYRYQSDDTPIEEDNRETSRLEAVGLPLGINVPLIEQRDWGVFMNMGGGPRIGDPQRMGGRFEFGVSRTFYRRYRVSGYGIVSVDTGDPLAEGFTLTPSPGFGVGINDFRADVVFGAPEGENDETDVRFSAGVDVSGLADRFVGEDSRRRTNARRELYARENSRIREEDRRLNSRSDEEGFRIARTRLERHYSRAPRVEMRDVRRIMAIVLDQNERRMDELLEAARYLKNALVFEMGEILMRRSTRYPQVTQAEETFLRNYLQKLHIEYQNERNHFMTLFLRSVFAQRALINADFTAKRDYVLYLIPSLVGEIQMRGVAPYLQMAQGFFFPGSEPGRYN